MADSQKPLSEVAAQLGRQHCPLDKPLLDDPHLFYEKARREAPIFFSEQLHAWIVTRYDDVRAILLQPDLFSARDTLRPLVEFTPAVFEVLGKGPGYSPAMVSEDGMEHTRLRTPFNPAFRPAQLKAMEPSIRGIAHRLVDELLPLDQADLVAQFASPLAGEVMLSMYGIPLADLAQCRRWSDEVHALTASRLSAEQQVECAHSLIAFQYYLLDFIEKRRSQIGGDGMSALLTIPSEGSAESTLVELAGNLMGILQAGHATTKHLISSAVYLLLSQPERWQQICLHPDIIPQALEEVLRFDSPVHLFLRTAMQVTQIGGATIAEGDLLLLAYISANRDETQCPHADQFEMDRSPNRHLAFGHGSHFCIGAPLARIEGRVALEVLSQRLPGLHLLSDQQPPHHATLQFRGLEHLSVVW